MALAVPLSRFTSQVGGGSAFFVRPLTHATMTDAQKQQFKKFGCTSRCIIKLTELRGHPITADDFVYRFIPCFPQWSVDGRCGLLAVSDMIDVCRALGIARHAHTFQDTDKVREFMQGGVAEGVFLLTERYFEGLDDGSHCSLVRSIGDRVRIWSPADDGQDMDDLPMSFDTLSKSLAHFLVLLSRR